MMTDKRDDKDNNTLKSQLSKLNFPVSKFETDFITKSKREKIPKHQLQSAWQVAVVLVVTVLLVTWYKSDKIASYWQQKHETNQPFNMLTDSDIGQAGQVVDTVAKNNTLKESLAYLSDKMNQGMNAAFYAPNKPASVTITDTQTTENQSSQQPATTTATVAVDKPNADSTAAVIVSATPDVTPTPESNLPNEEITRINLENGKKALFVGDSLMQGVAPWVMRELQNQYQIDSMDLSKHSTGLAFSKFFDWPATVETTLTDNPDINALFVFLGGNDGQSIVDPNTERHVRFGSDRWNELYSEKIVRIVDAAKQHNVQLLWVSPPNMKNKSLSKKTAHLSHLFETIIEKQQGLVLSSNNMLKASVKSDKYSDKMRLNGKLIKVRTADGVHFTIKGQKIIAKSIMEKIDINGQPMAVKK